MKLITAACVIYQVRMVTGDNIQTAKAIALECGILASDADASEPNVIEGKSFRSLSEVERQEIAEKISVWSLFLYDYMYLWAIWFEFFFLWSI